MGPPAARRSGPWHLQCSTCPRAPSGTRTRTEPILSRLPLPVGLWGQRRWRPVNPRGGAAGRCSGRGGGGAAAGQDVVEHRLGEPAGERVLLRDVVGADEADAAAARGGQLRLRAVAEHRPGARHRPAEGGTRRERRPPGDAAEGEHRRRRRLQEGDLPFQPAAARGPLLRGRGVAGRGAAHRRDDAGAGELQAVVGGDGGGLVGVPGPVQGGEDPVAGPVAGEQPAGAVGAVCRRGEPDDEEVAGRVAETGRGPPPGGLVGEGARLDVGDVLPPGDEPGAGSAHTGARVEGGQVAAAGGEPAHPGGGAGDGRLRRGRVPRPPAARRDVPHQRRLRAMPSRMSCSLVRTVVRPPAASDTKVTTSDQMSAPAPMTSTRPGCMKPREARWARVAPRSAAHEASTVRVGTSAPSIRSRSYAGRPSACAVTVVTDPATPTMVRTSSSGSSEWTCSSSVRMSLRAALTCLPVGGSDRRWRSVMRTLPIFTETPALGTSSPRTNSVDPPPMSTTRIGRSCSGPMTLAAPAKDRAASSWPLMTSGSTPRSLRTPETNVCRFPASRVAEVATKRVVSTSWSRHTWA